MGDAVLLIIGADEKGQTMTASAVAGFLRLKFAILAPKAGISTIGFLL
jgi:hypothetical protein